MVVLASELSIPECEPITQKESPQTRRCLPGRKKNEVNIKCMVPECSCPIGVIAFCTSDQYPSQGFMLRNLGVRDTLSCTGVGVGVRGWGLAGRPHVTMEIKGSRSPSHSYSLGLRTFLVLTIVYVLYMLKHKSLMSVFIGGTV